MIPDANLYKHGRVSWGGKYEQRFPAGVPCFFERKAEARGYCAPLMTREVAEQVAAIHNQSLAEDDGGDGCWLLFDGADLHVTSQDYDPDSCYIIEATEGLYDLSDFPWDRAEYANSGEEELRLLRLSGRGRGRRNALSSRLAA